ncbi:MAG TPA: metalloregulator ArsR/SmtB family transcription factor [Longimicrobiales bacterium]|nr:metalloregulator ArsR/SmtB family transcription factor [Longimicrobiales bacterium]
MSSVPVESESPHVEETARMLRCLGHPVRLCILDLLERKDELTVGEIHDALGLEQAAASQHLNLMRDRGILDRRKEGVNAYYRIGDDRALKVLACIRSGQP